MTEVTRRRYLGADSEADSSADGADSEHFSSVVLFNGECFESVFLVFSIFSLLHLK